MKIESVNNPKVKEWMKLKEKKHRDLENKFMIEGDHLFREAKDKGVIEVVLATDRSFEIPNIPFYEVSDAVIRKLSSQVSGTNVICICRKMMSAQIKGNVCILDCIQDPGNLGTIIRSAVAFNIDTIVMSLDTVDLYNEKVLRASEGMFFHVNMVKRELEEVFLELSKKDYKIYGTDVLGGTNLKEIDFSDRCAVVIGSEGLGMAKKFRDKCDKLIYIPTSEKCESLNAGVAASIIMYEMSR